MSKKFYLRDEEIQSRDDDFFRHEDLAANVEHIIKTVAAPYNIAVIGKWGLGKSSLINMALSGIKNQKDDYLCVYINAWKYEKEILSRVFLRHVMSRLQPGGDNEQEKVKKSIFSSLKQILRNNTATTGGFKESLKSFISRYWQWGLGYFGVSLLLYILYRCMTFYLNPVESASFWYYVWSILSGYLRNSATMLLAPSFLFLLTNVAFDFKNNPLHRVGFQLPEIKVEDYEHELGVLIDNKLSNNSNFKIIITLDDLDRLSTEKMVEALDAIKMFINFRNCVFIVPFDDSILKTAINKNRFSELGNRNIYEGEQVLDKLFQYKIYLMPQLGYDIKKYARSICCEQLKDFFVEYCDEKTFMKALDRVVIHYDVTTPRQVKKLVNTFISNIMLARRRENEDKLPKGFATTEKGVFTIAKLSVLQADYNEFYDLLFDDPELMDKVLQYQKDRNYGGEETHEENAIDVFSDTEKEVIGIGKDGGFVDSSASLLNYLHSTRNFGKENISSYLYMTEDDITRIAGAKNQRDFIKAASSGNSGKCLNFLAENPEMAAVAEECLKSSNDGVAIAGILSAVSSVYKNISKEYVTRIANAVADRVDDILDIWQTYEIEGIDTEGLLALYESSENKESFEDLIDNYIEYPPQPKSAVRDISSFLDKKDILSGKTLNLLNEYINKALLSNVVDYKEMIKLRRDYGIVDVPWLGEYYKYLITGINENNDNSSISFSELRAIYLVVSEKDAKKAFEELEPLFNKEWATEIITEFIKKDRDYLPNALICDLIEQQIVLEDKDNEKINGLLTIYDYKISEEVMPQLDLYLKDQVSEEEIIDLLETYSKNNAIKNIPETVNSVIKTAFDEHNDIIVNCVKMLIRLDEGDYLPIILQNIKNASVINQTDYSGIAAIMSEYASKKADDILAQINVCITQMSANSSLKPKLADNYYHFMTEFFELEFDNDEFSSSLQNFLSAVISRIKSKIDIEAGIKTLIRLSDKITDDLFKDVEPVLYGLCSDVDKIKNIYVLFEKKKALFGDEEGQIDSNDLVEVCLNAIEKTVLKNEAIQTLGREYIYFNEIPRFASLIREEEIDTEAAYSICGKFINEKLKEEANPVAAVHDITTIITNEGLEFIEEILEDQVATLLNVIETVLVQKDEFAYNEIQSIASWILLHVKDDRVNVYVDELVSILACDVDNKDSGIELLALIEKIPKNIFQKKREKYLSIFVRLVTKGFGEQFNERLMVLGQTRNVSRDVIAQAPDSMCEELSRYVHKKKKNAVTNLVEGVRDGLFKI